MEPCGCLLFLLSALCYCFLRSLPGMLMRYSNQIKEEERKTQNKIDAQRVKQMHVNERESLFWKNKGCNLHNQGKYEEAIKCYDKAMVLGDKDFTTWNNKGIALSKLGHYEAAINCFDEMLSVIARTDKECSDVLNNKGIALSKLGHHEAAINYFDKALDFDQNHKEARENKEEVSKKLEK